MFRLLVIASCAFTVITCNPLKRQDKASDLQGSEGGHAETFASFGDHGGLGDSGFGGGSGKSGFSSGNGLKIIAQSSAQQANDAIHNQQSAAQQAAYVAKSKLAQNAAGAAATAQAALAGKQILVQRLEQELHEAHQQVEAEFRQLQEAQNAAAAARESVHQAQQQFNSLNAAINAAQGTIAHATQAAQAADSQLGSQAAMVGAAKQKLSTLSQQLHQAQSELAATQAAAQQASAAAHIAQANAAKAGDAASSSLHSGGFGGDEHGFSSGGFGHY